MSSDRVAGNIRLWFWHFEKQTLAAAGVMQWSRARVDSGWGFQRASPVLGSIDTSAADGDRVVGYWDKEELINFTASELGVLRIKVKEVILGTKWHSLRPNRWNPIQVLFHISAFTHVSPLIHSLTRLFSESFTYLFILSNICWVPTMCQTQCQVP